MKRLAIYLHPYLGRIGLGFTIKFMGTLLDLMIPWMLSTIIDEVIPTREFQRVLLWGCMMLFWQFQNLLDPVGRRRAFGIDHEHSGDGDHGI